MKIVISLIFLLILNLPIQSYGQTSNEFELRTGNDFLANCNIENPKTELSAMKSLYCIGAITGMANSYQTTIIVFLAKNSDLIDKDISDKVYASNTRSMGICLDDKIPNSQLMDMFIKYLKDHPETRNLNTSGLYYFMLSTNFPCESDQAKSEEKSGWRDWLKSKL